jgi:hypothetical protein
MSQSLILKSNLDKAGLDLNSATKSLGIVWDNVDDTTGRQLAFAVEALGRAVASVSLAVEVLAQQVAN